MKLICDFLRQTRSTALALFLLVPSATLIALPQQAFATKTVVQLPIQLTAPQTVKQGATFEYLLHIPVPHQ